MGERTEVGEQDRALHGQGTQEVLAIKVRGEVVGDEAGGRKRPERKYHEVLRGVGLWMLSQV